MADLNEAIHQTVRLRIVSALASLAEDARVDFTYMKNLLKLSDDNLGAHLLKLEEAGYLVQEKTFFDRKPRTYLHLTREGRVAFHDHVAALKEILGQA